MERVFQNSLVLNRRLPVLDFIELCMMSYIQVVRLFLCIIPFPTPSPTYLLKFSDRNGGGDNDQDIAHYNGLAAGDSSLTEQP